MATQLRPGKPVIGVVTSPSGKRAYELSHPWLKFRVDLSNAPYQLWLLLGEARSKIDHIAGVPLRPETAERLHRVYVAKGARATTAIEGNSLSEEQVLDHLEGKLKLPPSQQYLAQEIDNVVKACNRILDDVFQQHVTALSPSMIKRFNTTVLEDLTLEDDVVPGSCREHAVRVGNYHGAPYQDCEHLLELMCNWLNNDFDNDREDMLLPIAVIRAVLAHLYLAWIHPFGDGNGRTARLVEVQILVAAGVPTPAAHLMSNHYNQTRTEYYRQLDRASHSGGDVVPFLLYAIEGFVDGLKAQLRHIREQQLEVAWENHVHAAFREHKGATADRRKWLVLDMSKGADAFSRDQMRELSPRLVRAYSSKTDKTLARDLNALSSLKLVTRLADGRYRANKRLIRAFLPAMNRPETSPEDGPERTA